MGFGTFNRWGDGHRLLKAEAINLGFACVFAIIRREDLELVLVIWQIRLKGNPCLRRLGDIETEDCSDLQVVENRGLVVEPKAN